MTIYYEQFDDRIQHAFIRRYIDNEKIYLNDYIQKKHCRNKFEN